MQTILFTRGDTLCLVSPILDSKLTIEQVAEKCVPIGLTHYVVDSSILPTDSTFSSAWELDASQPDAVAVSINMPKAREIGHVMRRAQRQELLAPLDAEINYAVSDSAKVAEMDAQRQEIKAANAAMQTAIDAADTPEEIKIALGM